MTPIELTDLHKSKLLEMCKTLFPDYYHINFYSEQSKTLQISETGKDLNMIHWFEFCCNTLANKLFDSSFDFGKIYYEILKSDNPVDYLYDQFKQLKIK